MLSGSQGAASMRSVTHTALLLDSGATPKVAQRQLRHSDARTTLEIYGHVVGDADREAVEKVASIVDAIGRNYPTSIPMQQVLCLSQKKPRKPTVPNLVVRGRFLLLRFSGVSLKVSCQRFVNFRNRHMLPTWPLAAFLCVYEQDVNPPLPQHAKQKSSEIKQVKTFAWQTVHKNRNKLRCSYCEGRVLSNSRQSSNFG